MRPFLKYFERLEGRKLTERYLAGLIMERERKQVEPMSERFHASERGKQRLFTEVKWDYEGRSWLGWHRHVLLVFLAFGYLTQLRLQENNS